MRTIQVGNVKIANNLPLVLIAGPCQMETRDHALMMASNIKIIADKLNIPFIYKSSFDKANRTSIDGKRGLGLEKTLPIFAEIKKTFGCPILTDIHNEQNCRDVDDSVDIIQVPAFLCRQTDLLIAAGETQIPVNIKKGQFLAPQDVKYCADKVLSTGNQAVFITERGTTFGYQNLVVDMRSIPIIQSMGFPLIFDATHSVQIPSGADGKSGGKREFAPVLAKAAVAAGCSGLFLETHPDPDNAPSDGPNMLPVEWVEPLLETCLALRQVVQKERTPVGV
jgi:2-dehydro-3-deoxyphosphooctonate aldolase (KDO 8-P synthase)